MAIGKTAGCLILAGAMWGAQFTVLHEHWRKGCKGVMTIDENGVQFAGPKGHAWKWKYQDVEQLKLAPGRVEVLTYADNILRLGTDRVYEFTGTIPAGSLYPMLKERMDQRLVAEIAEPGEGWRLAVKRLGIVSGSEGTLRFGESSIVYSTDATGQSRTWRYADIDNISSSGPFQLTVTSYERARSHYGDRKGFNFELKQPITEAQYNGLWLQIEKKNGRVQ